MYNIISEYDDPKAYVVRDDEGNTGVFYAMSPGKAKSEAIHSASFIDDYFIDLYARRVPELDDFYPGVPTLDWKDQLSRSLMVRYAGMHCSYDEIDPDCDCCAAAGHCDRYKSENFQEE